jgi:S1-C subfamily serine protease
MASFGVISALVSRRGRRGGPPLIRPDLTMYPGFSGGPLVNASGQVIGINSSHLGRDGGLAMPSETVDRIVSALSSDGRIRRAYLGVASQPARLATEIDGSDAVLLAVMVDPGSPAAEGGLLVGDSIVSVDGARMGSGEDLQMVLDEIDVGAELTLTIARGGETAELTITAGERP